LTGGREICFNIKTGRYFKKTVYDPMKNKGIQTKEKITKQALQLFSVKGYFNTSIMDILDATGLTKGGLYGHFASKEEIWYSVYEEALRIWRARVFPGNRHVSDPLDRIKWVVENHLRSYLGGDAFAGGCFFVNMLVEVSGQSEKLTKKILKGFVSFSRLLQGWLDEADVKGVLGQDIDKKGVADFIVISLNGAATLYSASREKAIWEETLKQIDFFIEGLKKS
jgi:TetR/AcrR family transcriptional regulator, transcriptional repressor for nem operon